MFNKLRSVITESRVKQEQILLQSRENVWAQVFHDSIRGKEFLQDLPLNVGRWAGNYSFFYILNRILTDFKPPSILEFGLGESSKFVSVYLDNYLVDSRHIIIEHDENWADSFTCSFQLSERSVVKILPLEEIEVEGHKCKVYERLEECISEKFSLYIIDGPFGSRRYSRFDLMTLVNRIDCQDEFIFLVDDCNRIGEMETVKCAIDFLKSRQITHYTRLYEGSKSQMLIASHLYKHVTTL